MSERPFDIVINGTQQMIELRIIENKVPIAGLGMNAGGALALATSLQRAVAALAGLVDTPPNPTRATRKEDATMSERKCEWCGATERLLPKADECVDSTGCANRILDKKADALVIERDTLRARVARLEEALRQALKELNQHGHAMGRGICVKCDTARAALSPESDSGGGT